MAGIGLRITLFSAALSVMGATPTLAATYCEGWREGYVQGYQAQTGQRPFAPACPFPPFPKPGEPQDEGQRGKIHGVIAGAAAGAT